VRVLVATADLGEGHNAAARALSEAFRAAYPGCVVRTVEMFGLLGRRMRLTTQWAYVLGVGPFGWCYQLFFDAVWRCRWFADLINGSVGRRAGPALEREIARFAPDVVVTTFPMASAGLAWLRRRGRLAVLAVPAVAVIPDFAPHPFWVLPNLDLHLVSHEVCLADVEAVSPAARARVVTAPVERRFAPAERGVQTDVPLTVLATFGGLGLGHVSRVVGAVLDAGPSVRLIVVCGRNARLRRAVQRLDRGDGRLDARGWVEDMPALLREVDAVLSNAGGASVLEALACGLPTILADPLPGHGRANAARMAQAGLALVCATPADLTGAVRRLVEDPEFRTRLGDAASGYAGGRDLAADLRSSVGPLLIAGRRRAPAPPRVP
jgi:UDP-N-acetylglucosamine:LPS N-acetylglucosamine transferase